MDACHVYDACGSPQVQRSQTEASYMSLLPSPQRHQQVNAFQLSTVADIAPEPPIASTTNESALQPGCSIKQRLFLIVLIAVLCLIMALLVVILCIDGQTLSQVNEIKNPPGTASGNSSCQSSINSSTISQYVPNASCNPIEYQQLLNKSSETAQKLTDIIKALTLLHQTSTSTAAVVDTTLLMAQELLALHNGSSDSTLPTSCKMIMKESPSIESGLYLLTAASDDGPIIRYEAYCHMGNLCGSSEGGWTRLAYLNMSDAMEDCPSGFKLYKPNDGMRACGRPAAHKGGGCVSIQFPSNGIEYTQVCGRVVGYQYKMTDAIDNTNSNRKDLNGHYVV